MRLDPISVRRAPIGLRMQNGLAAILLASALTGCAYFNTFYNANSYFETGLAALAAAGGSGGTTIPRPAREAFGTAVEKSLKVIDTYPESRYVDDAFFIIGRSHFYRREYGLAERYLRQLLQEYPWSPFVNEARVWLARVHAELGLLEELEADLAPVLAMKSPPRRLLTDIFVLRGDLALRQGDTAAAIIAFESGAQRAGDPVRRATIYHQLYSLAADQADYGRALDYLDKYARTTLSERERVNARLTRVQLLQKGGDLASVYQDIRNMMSLSEFASIVPGLVLELGKIELQQGDADAAAEHFEEVAEEFPTLPEASEAAYRAGELYLADLSEASAARAYFKRVKRNTSYYQAAQIKLKQLETLDQLEKNINTLRAQLRGGGYEGAAAGEPGARGRAQLDERPARQPGAGAGNRAQGRAATVEDVELDTAQVRQDLAYAMYRTAEIQFFDMYNSELALKLMATIVSTLPETEVAAQAAYVLHVQTAENPEQALFWRSLILEQYPRSTYGLVLSGAAATARNSALERLVAQAGDQVIGRPEAALGLFRNIRRRFGTEQSAFAIAYLYDEYLAELDSAITAYDEYLTVYPQGTYQQVASRRLEFLRRIQADVSGKPTARDGGAAP